MRSTEHQEQQAVIQWWAHACKGYGLPEFALLAIPNGAVLAGDSRRRAMQMHRLKAEGLRAGVPDLFLAVTIKEKVGYPEKLPRGQILAPGLFLEMKRKPNEPSAAQLQVMAYLRRCGYAVALCYSADEAIKTIKEYLL